MSGNAHQKRILERAISSALKKFGLQKAIFWGVFKGLWVFAATAGVVALAIGILSRL